LAENFAGFDYPSACGCSSFLCLEKHGGFRFYPQQNSFLWSSFYHDL